MPIDSKECAAALRRQFRKDHGRAAKPAEIEALREAMVDEHSLSTGGTREVFRRVAEHEGKFYLDLANDAREVVEIDREGWQIVTDPPVTFYRHDNVHPLPTPTRGGTLDELRGHLPPTLTDRDYLLIVGAVLSWLNPTIGYPILAFRSSQASGKSVTARMLQKLIDPQVTDECGLPQKDEDLALAANSSWTLFFGNLGTISERISNVLCRISTGGAFRCRKLYGQNEECFYRFRRPIILNGIGNFMTRGDLLGRTYLIDLEPLTGRKTEAELWKTTTPPTRECSGVSSTRRLPG